tara:strand:- start:582 stop:1550 length:969 start_codon:yes stop_codon:yes gene_type:complete
MDNYNYLPIVARLGYQTIHSKQVLQTLWGGYGELVRLWVDSTSIVIKHVLLPKPEHHPRGWNTELSHQRKLRSYQVELSFYQAFANECSTDCKVPRTLLVEHSADELLLVMEDLHQLGFTKVLQQAEKHQLSACLHWFAHFHAQHIENPGVGLWESGTYWHLETRPDELAALSDHSLKQAAQIIDETLKSAPYQTLVHGDGKLANFCFEKSGNRAAAVDFQYVGKGCAMKDVALFMSSAVAPEHCAEMEAWILDEYFSHLRDALSIHQPKLEALDVEQAWRPLFSIAWADFQRFVKGWSPEHWKINSYTESLKERALSELAR